MLAEINKGGGIKKYKERVLQGKDKGGGEGQRQKMNVYI